MKKVIIGAYLLLWAVCTNAQSEDIHYQVKGEKNTYGIIYNKKLKYSFIQNMGAPLYKPVYYDDHYVRIVRGFRITDISHDEEYIKNMSSILPNFTMKLCIHAMIVINGLVTTNLLNISIMYNFFTTYILSVQFNQ